MAGGVSDACPCRREAEATQTGAPGPSGPLDEGAGWRDASAGANPWWGAFGPWTGADGPHGQALACRRRPLPGDRLQGTERLGALPPGPASPPAGGESAAPAGCLPHGPLGLRVRIHRTVTGNGRLKRRIQQRRRLGIRRAPRWGWPNSCKISSREKSSSCRGCISASDAGWGDCLFFFFMQIETSAWAQRAP